MKRFILAVIIFLTISLNHVFTQNLVVNPSFEITNTNCTALGGEGFRADLNPNWDNANSNIPGDSCSSPDLFSACNTLPGFGPSATFMPDATSFGIGWQYSRTGTRHAGFIGYSAPFGFENNYREYIQGRTTTPLVSGQVYCVSFYLSLADGCPYSISNIGVHFRNNQFLRDACAQGSLINLTPQLVNTCGTIGDTMNWVRLQWQYTATGGEQYFIIGNFNNDANTNESPANGSGFGNYFAYYFIDDVSIVANTCCYAEVEDQTVCLNDAPFNLTTSSGLGNCSLTQTGTWSGTGITSASNGTFSPTVAGVGNHTITFTLSCGYVATTTITVSPCQALQVCTETNGQITASNGLAPYTWSYLQPAGTTQITNQATCTACGYSWNSFVNQCLNGFIPATSCNSPATWVQFGTGNTVTIPAGQTQIQVTDNGGGSLIFNPSTVPACSTTPTCPTITVTTSSQSNVTCNGLTNGSATVSATGGTAPYSYTWQPGNLSGATQSNLAANTYIISVTDVNNCPGTGTVTITQPAALAGTTSSNNATCGSSNGSASINVTGGIAPYTYAWSPTGGNAATANNLAAGNYSVTVTDGNNCQITQSVTVNSAGGATITIGTVQNPTCTNSTNGSIQTTITGGATPYSIQWTPSGGTSANASNLGAGTYTITVTDNNNCVSSATATLTAPPAITGTISTNPATCGATDGSATVTATGGTGNLSYSWSPTGGNAATANGLSSGPYTVTVSDQNQCSVTFNANVPANGGPTVTINTVSPVLCANGTNGQLTANVSGGTAPFTYSWSPSGGSAASASNLSPGTYTVTVTDAASCVVSATTTLTNPSGINIQENIVPENCGALDGSISVLATGGSGNYTYAWTPDVGSSSSITNLENGDYSVIVTDGNGCSATETYTVSQTGGITITANALPSAIEEGQSSQLNAQGGISYTWSPSNTLSCSDCPNPIATPTETTSYAVVGTDANGCSGEATITIVVNPLCGNVYIPTIFSPNLDGSNDFECVMGNCIVELEFQIFNRWGEVVFQTTDPSVCWDGDYKGKPVNSGTFAYKAYVRRLDGTTESYSGNITLVR